MVFALLLGAASIAFLTVALQMIWFGERRKRFAKRLDEALQLLKECAGHLTAATHADPAADFVEYDEQIMRASERLRRLFALREIGDGFGATINALLWALQNQLGERLTAKQLSNLLDVIDQLRKRPMLHFDSSMRLLDQLEDSCLNIEPPGLDLLSLQNE